MWCADSDGGFSSRAGQLVVRSIARRVSRRNSIDGRICVSWFTVRFEQSRTVTADSRSPALPSVTRRNLDSSCPSPRSAGSSTALLRQPSIRSPSPPQHPARRSVSGDVPSRVGLCAFASRTSPVSGQRPARRHRRCRSCQETWTRSVLGPWPRATCAPLFSSWESVTVPQRT